MQLLRRRVLNGDRMIHSTYRIAHAQHLKKRILKISVSTTFSLPKIPYVPVPMTWRVHDPPPLCQPHFAHILECERQGGGSICREMRTAKPARSHMFCFFLGNSSKKKGLEKHFIQLVSVLENILYHLCIIFCMNFSAEIIIDRGEKLTA